MEMPNEGSTKRSREYLYRKGNENKKLENGGDSCQSLTLMGRALAGRPQNSCYEILWNYSESFQF